jgi:hypothetical protein
MRDFVKQDLFYVFVARALGEVFRQRDAFCAVVTLPKPCGGSVPFKSPLGEKPVRGEEVLGLAGNPT